MFNKVQLVTFPHVVLSAYMTGGAFLVGVAGWLYLRRSTPRTSSSTARRSGIGAVVALVAGLGVADLAATSRARS